MRTSDGHPTFKADDQLVEDQRPIPNGAGPFLEDLPVDQEQELPSSLWGGKRTFGFCDLAQLAMVAFHRVRGVDQPSDLRRIGEEGGQVFPVGLPHPLALPQGKCVPVSSPALRACASVGTNEWRWHICHPIFRGAGATGLRLLLGWQPGRPSAGRP